MGAFFSNIQIRSPRSDVPAIAEAMRHFAAEAGFVNDAEPSDEAGRDIFVVANTDSPDWITVCDSLLRHNGDELLDVTRRFSQAASSTAIGIAVDDSDVLLLHYCLNGGHIDSFSNIPDYGDMSREMRAKLAGDASRWKDLLVAGASPDQLTACWSSHHTFVEEMLADFCQLTSLNYMNCALDASTLAEGNPERCDVLQHIRLKSPIDIDDAFVKDKPAKFHGPGKGPVKITLRGHLGAPLSFDPVFARPSHHPLAQFENHGGQSTGLSIVLAGSAIDQSLIEVERLHIYCNGIVTVAAPEPVQTNDGSSALRLRLPDYVIPAGIEAGTMEQLRHTMPLLKWFELRQHITIHIAALGSYKNTGTGVLNVFIVPRENAQEGSAWAMWEVSVCEATEVPKPS